MIKKLFCIPYLGGTAAAFDGLMKEIDGAEEIIALEYAGHGSRRVEEFYTDFDAMVEDVSRQIKKQLKDGEEYGLLGYSLGALVAYEVLRQKKLTIPPQVVFFAAQIPPHLFTQFKVQSTMEDEEFVTYLIEYGWVDKSILDKRRFWPLLLKTLREDLRIRETYTITDSITSFACNLCILYNQEDIPQQIAHSWEKYSTKECRFVEIGSTHMFIHTHANEVAKIIQKY